MHAQSTHVSPQFFTRSIEQFGGKIPFIVTDLIAKMRELNALGTEGIFRLSGSSRDISCICGILDNGRISDWSDFKSVHVLGGALKKFFRDQVNKDPLFPHSVYEDIISIPNISGQDAQIARFKEIMATLSRARQMTIAFLFDFLIEIVEHSAQNKMDANNISIVFAPNLLSPPGVTANDTLQTNAIQNRVISLVLKLGRAAFENIEVPETAFIKDEDFSIINSPPINRADIETFAELRALRRRSLIPYVPYQFIGNPDFVRPTRAVDLTKE